MQSTPATGRRYTQTFRQVSASEPIFRSSSWVGGKDERLLSVRLADLRGDGPQGPRRADTGRSLNPERTAGPACLIGEHGNLAPLVMDKDPLPVPAW